MAHLKLAYRYGKKLAFDESGLSPEQMNAAVRLSGLGGGALGAGLGGMLGNYVGGRLGESNDWSPGLSRGIGTGLGALLGGGLGAYAGTQLPRLKGTKEPGLAPAGAQESSGELSPEALGLLQTIPGFSPGIEPSYPENALGFMDDSGYGMW
jgi:hypothetical protein